MKYLLLLSFLSSSAFAIDFNKVSGSFNMEEKSKTSNEEDHLAEAAFGSFNPHDEIRSPASLDDEKKDQPGINEVTGSFQN